MTSLRMTSLLDYFSKLRLQGKKGFIPYLVAGYPKPSSTPLLLKTAARAGVTAIELGVPFSDPIADGPVLQKASFKSLENGTTLNEILHIVAEVKHEIKIPILLMGYTNPFLQQGWKSLAEKSKKAGVSGFIIADLPAEESKKIQEILDSFDLGLCPLSAPTTDHQRIAKIDQICTGFIYLVAVKGVTGTRKDLSPELLPWIQKVRKKTKKPLYVGFGLSAPEQMGKILTAADGVILGSRIAEFLEEHQDDSNLEFEFEKFLAPWVRTAQCYA